MRKYTNILAISFFALFIGMMTLSTVLLNKMASVYDFTDEFRHFDKHELPPFQYVSLDLGYVFKKQADQENNEAITLDWATMHADICQDSAHKVYIHKSMKDSIQWFVKEDTLFLKGFNSEERVRSSAKIYAPQVKGIHVNKTDVSMEGFQGEELAIQAMNHSKIALGRFMMNLIQFNLNHSELSIENSEIQALKVQGSSGSLSLDDVKVITLEQAPDHGVSVSLKGKSVTLLK